MTGATGAEAGSPDGDAGDARDAEREPEGLFVPEPTGAARPDPRVLPNAPVTRFAPAPTGLLHLGHLVNVIYVWGIARATGGRVILRIEDHDRQRSRSEHERALLEDLARLGIGADEPTLSSFAGPSPYRQSDCGGAYADALRGLRRAGLVYACRCSRATFERYAQERGRPWRGIGCPGACRVLALPEDGGDVGLRVAVGAGNERWVDLLAGPLADEPAAAGDLLVRDRLGNWTYAFCVVVDDLRHGVTLVVRGRDLLDATPVQLRLARLIGRPEPPAFLHHPLIRRLSGQKLSKAEGDTAVRALLDAGATPEGLFGRAARLAGLQAADAPVDPANLGALFRA